MIPMIKVSLCVLTIFLCRPGVAQYQYYKPEQPYHWGSLGAASSYLTRRQQPWSQANHSSIPYSLSYAAPRAYNSDTSSMLELSSHFSSKMRSLLEELSDEKETAAVAKIKADKDDNFILILRELAYTFAFLISFYLAFDGSTVFNQYDALGFAGRILGEAGLRGEDLLGIKQTDVSCKNDLNGIVQSFGIEEKFSQLEREMMYHGSGSPSLESQRQAIMLDLVNFKREAKEALGCVSSSRINGLLDLYTTAGLLRLESCI